VCGLSFSLAFFLSYALRFFEYICYNAIDKKKAELKKETEGR